MSIYDVIVVGGGPIGLAAGRLVCQQLTSVQLAGVLKIHEKITGNRYLFSSSSEILAMIMDQVLVIVVSFVYVTLKRILVIWL